MALGNDVILLIMALRNSQQAPFRQNDGTLEEGATAAAGQGGKKRPSHQRMTNFSDAYVKFQGVLTPIGFVLSGIILLGFAADLSWSWGIFVALADLAVAFMIVVQFRRERAKMTDKALEDGNVASSPRTTKRSNAEVALKVASGFLCFYSLILIFVQISCRAVGVSFASVIDSETGFPTKCEAALCPACSTCVLSAAFFS